MVARERSAPDDRRAGLLLAGLAVGALTVGAVWWVSAAPEGLSTAAPAPREGEPGVAARPGQAPLVAVGGADQASRSPNAGIADIFHVPPGSGVSIEIDPSTGRMAVLPGSRAVDELPRFTNTLLRSGTTLAEGGSRTWRLPTPDGGRYLLHYVCAGSGEVRVEVAGARRGPGRTAAGCSAPFSTVEVVAGGELTVTVRRLHPGAADVGVQLVGLP